ncbi:MAG: glyoxylase-like metal-dependent hydrolase (beta-lactamase superfamily II) [Halieaceae bacterium]|jgi:glyoxylase-like metal-dependent hydrolase (beta-lactamase superfamily II)
MRWILRIALLLVILTTIVLAVFLGPAHMQIRGVAPALPTEAQLRALASVPGGPLSIHFIESSSQRGPKRTLGHASVIIEWPNRRLFMIDAAMDDQASQDFGALIARLSPGMGPVEFRGTVADLLGPGVAAIDGVGFTHLHTDHVQGITAFCAARAGGSHLYQSTWQAREHNLHTKESALQLKNSCLKAVLLAGDGLLSHADFPGLGIAALGGHTPGSTLFAAHVEGTLWLMSGDISNVKEQLLSNTGKGWLYSNLLVPENTARTEELRLWLAALDAQPDIEVIVAHDIAAARDSGMRPLGAPD